MSPRTHAKGLHTDPTPHPVPPSARQKPGWSSPLSQARRDSGDNQPGTTGDQPETTGDQPGTTATSGGDRRRAAGH
ncbi:hypothetical protein Axi01nite_94280 [Actinoplanes xinjiangensis]|nr:hypothetical protein Axi01nite_94280 [Actinoplanes xinjiangensis]